MGRTAPDLIAATSNGIERSGAFARVARPTPLRVIERVQKSLDTLR